MHTSKSTNGTVTGVYKNFSSVEYETECGDILTIEVSAETSKQLNFQENDNVFIDIKIDKEEADDSKVVFANNCLAFIEYESPIGETFSVEVDNNIFDLKNNSVVDMRIDFQIAC